ncbi:hypothetical protein FN846DRAFT_84580 [Sphaerosporella brunnea]|uniref:Uncharacterized protein n=1 Tax=Sphaerosporella brunnea TaxID=1250544 RepID=A0A5J5ESU8_9PEZI|nr:hypothetical protein FN846DRAFT_84580 [Sphaerosporella brunnea]
MLLLRVFLLSFFGGCFFFSCLAKRRNSNYLCLCLLYAFLFVFSSLFFEEKIAFICFSDTCHVKSMDLRLIREFAICV